jgi:hypothetical protein
MKCLALALGLLVFGSLVGFGLGLLVHQAEDPDLGDYYRPRPLL